MKAKECMCRDIFYCTPDTKILDVAKMMKEKHVGCIPVCNEEKYVEGIVTDRDIILRSIACGKDVNTTNVSEIMTCNTKCCDCNDDISNITQIMGETGIRRLPVIEKGKLVGIVTIGDLAKHSNINQEYVGSTFENICNCKHQDC